MTDMPAVGRKFLDGQECSTPGCHHDHTEGLVVGGSCHPGAPTRATYSEGVLTFVCAAYKQAGRRRECGRPIARVAVADA